MNRRIVIVSLVAALLSPATNGFAQFQLVAKSARNLANLERAVAQASIKPTWLNRTLGRAPGIGRPVVTDLPAGIVPGNAIALQYVAMPQTVTLVNKSYITYLNDFYNSTVRSKEYPTPAHFARLAVHEWIEPAIYTGYHRDPITGEIVMEGNRTVSNVLYTQQEKLAQDLNAFYNGKADILVGPDGRAVKLYALPADGILYMPEECSTPLVLNASDYFVIYDVVAKTGKIAENKPEVYNSFKSPFESGEKIYGEFEFYEVEPGVESWRPKNLLQYYKWNHESKRNNELRLKKWEERGYPNQFASEYELGEALYQCYGNDVPGVLQPHVGWHMVYELPKPIVLTQHETGIIELNPEEYVVIYRFGIYGGGNGGKIVKRQEIENPQLFRFRR